VASALHPAADGVLDSDAALGIRELSELIREHPGSVRLRVLLSHVLLKENLDPQAAELSLQVILELDPSHQEAVQNLEVLKATTAR
jgi:hypothetical protein